MDAPGGPPSHRSIAARLFGASFRYYVVAAIALTGLLVVGEYVSARAALRRDMTIYEQAFTGSLGAALWAMDIPKLDAIATGMVEIPGISAVRIVDPANGYLFAVAINRPPGNAPDRDTPQERWDRLVADAPVSHAFDIAYTHATGTTVVGRAELLSDRAQLIERIKGQSALILAIALFKEAILWAIFLGVSQRMLVRPLRHLIAALAAARPEDPGQIEFPSSIEPVIAGTELTVVRDSFNILINRIHEQRAELIATNDRLEVQVAQRTRALEEANDSLRTQAERLEASNTELEQFAYVASHDLRQPLRMVSMYMQLLERNYGDRLDADGHTFIAFARDGAARMDRLILDLLALSRIGRTARPFEPVPFTQVIGDALATLKEDLDATAATVTSPADLPIVLGDADELARLMTNLVGNAVKYRSPDRPPEIAIGWRRDDDDGRYLFWVQDNGLGIPPEANGRIFQIFQRFHAEAGREGTGIGLAICKKIVERHGGRIWVESPIGEGSTFFFRLPAPPPEIVLGLV